MLSCGAKEARTAHQTKATRPNVRRSTPATHAGPTSLTAMFPVFAATRISSLQSPRETRNNFSSARGAANLFLLAAVLHVLDSGRKVVANEALLDHPSDGVQPAVAPAVCTRGTANLVTT